MRSVLPPVTQNLLIITVIVWVATIVLRKVGIIDLDQLLGLHFWLGSDFNPAQLVTYMFMYDTAQGFASFSHIFFNMFSLWMFGVTLERVLGAKRFLTYYLVCGIGGGIIQELTWQLSWQSILADINGMDTATLNQVIAGGGATIQNQLNSFYNSLVTVGASAAVFGILLAFGVFFPNMKLFIIPIPVPIKAKWLVIGYGLLELVFGVTGAMSGVAHFAHLGGMLFGLLLIIYWRKRGIIGGGHGYY